MAVSVGVLQVVKNWNGTSDYHVLCLLHFCMRFQQDMTIHLLFVFLLSARLQLFRIKLCLASYLFSHVGRKITSWFPRCLFGLSHYLIYCSHVSLCLSRIVIVLHYFHIANVYLSTGIVYFLTTASLFQIQAVYFTPSMVTVLFIVVPEWDLKLLEFYILVIIGLFASFV